MYLMFMRPQTSVLADTWPGRSAQACCGCSQGVRLAIRDAVHGGHLRLQHPAAEGACAEYAGFRRHAAECHCGDAAIAKCSDACSSDRCLPVCISQHAASPCDGDNDNHLLLMLLHACLATAKSVTCASGHLHIRQQLENIWSIGIQVVLARCPLRQIIACMEVASASAFRQ